MPGDGLLAVRVEIRENQQFNPFPRFHSARAAQQRERIAVPLLDHLDVRAGAWIGLLPQELEDQVRVLGNAALAEASPYDGIWGIRLSAEEARNTAPSAWPGRNLQGKLLTELREEFRAKGTE